MSRQKNSLKKTKLFNFAESTIPNPDRYLRVGITISISVRLYSSVRLKPVEEHAAEVIKVSPDGIWLGLFRPTTELPFREGEKVRIKFWEEQTVYYFDSKVVTVSGASNQHLSIARPSEGVSVQRRRAFRVAAEVPFSFTVIDASETDLKGRKVTSVETQDLSVSGLSFHTSLPLRMGDKLEIKLQLSSSVNPHKPSSESVSASGWVVRSEPDEQDEESGSLVCCGLLDAGAEGAESAFAIPGRTSNLGSGHGLDRFEIPQLPDYGVWGT